jgi:hypothetical protein
MPVLKVGRYQCSTYKLFGSLQLLIKMINVLSCMQNEILYLKSPDFERAITGQTHISSVVDI